MPRIPWENMPKCVESEMRKHGKSCKMSFNVVINCFGVNLRNTQIEIEMNATREKWFALLQIGIFQT